MKSFGNAVGRESGSGENMAFMPRPKKRRIGRRRGLGIEMATARETEMSGIEAGTAADRSGMEGQSAAAEETSPRAPDTGLKMQPPLQDLPGRKRTVAMAPQGARSGSRPPQRLPIGILSGVTGHPVGIGTGL